MNSKIKADKRSPIPLAILFVVLGVFATASDTSAQWTTNGNNINNTNSGNVGVGTTSPAGNLDVNGPDAAPTSGSSTNGTFLLGALPATNLVLSGGVSTSGSIFSWFQSRNRTSAAFYNLSLNPLGGNVGVGTSSPSQKLEVAGNVLVSNGGILRTTGGVDGYLILDGTAGGEVQFSKSGTIKWALGTDVGVVGDDLNLYNYNGSAVRLTVLNSNGNVGIGTTSPAYKLDVNGDVRVSGNLAAKYQDVAEWVFAREKLVAGTVVALDPEKSNQVMASAQAYDTRVAGVVSSQPGITLGEAGAGKVLVATTGRVKVKVDATSGPIQIGDLLVTSDKAGFAMKSQPMMIGGRQLHAPGTLIGKALEPLPGGTGEILVLLSLQ